MIKHKWFTCNCNSEKCRYNRASIQTFLKEYYERTGEEIATTTATGSKIKKEVKTEATVKVEAAEVVPAPGISESEGAATPTEDGKTKRAFKKPSTVERPKRVKKQDEAAK